MSFYPNGSVMTNDGNLSSRLLLGENENMSDGDDQDDCALDLSTALWGSTTGQIKMRYTRDIMNELRGTIFHNGVVFNNILSGLNVKDHKNMQLVCAAFDENVRNDGPSWRKRRVLITKENVKEITLKCNRSVHSYTSVRIDHLGIRELRSLKYLCPELEELQVYFTTARPKNKLAAKFMTNIYNEVFPHLTDKLKRLVISIDLFFHSTKEDICRFEALFQGLKSFEVRLLPVKNLVISTFADRQSVLEAINSFQWNLDSMHMRFPGFMRQTLSENLVNTLCHLEFQSGGNVSWDEIPLIPNLSSLVAILGDYISDINNESRRFRIFLQKQPLLTSLTVKSKTVDYEEENSEGRRYSIDMANIIGSRCSRLQHLSVELPNLPLTVVTDPADHPVFTFDFIQNLEHLQTLNLEVFVPHNTRWYVPENCIAAWVIDYAPTSLRKLSITDRCREPTQFLPHMRYRAHSRLPNLESLDINCLNTCMACAHQAKSRARPFMRISVIQHRHHVDEV